MATRSKNTKNSALIKILCIVLSVASFFGFINLGTNFIVTADILGFKNYVKGNIPSFTESQRFVYEINKAMFDLLFIKQNNIGAFEEIAKAKKEEIINNAVNAYFDRKAYIIKSELEYAVNNYDESYYNFEDSADGINATDYYSQNGSESVTSTTDRTVSGFSDYENAPKNIQEAMYALENCKGHEFLSYEQLVRSEAFEVDFSHSEQIEIGEEYKIDIVLSSDMTASETVTVKNAFSKQYDEQIDNQNPLYTDYLYDTYINLERRPNIKYYIESADGTVETNLDNAPDLDLIKKSGKIYAYCGIDENGGRISDAGGFSNKNSEENIKSMITSGDGTFLMYLDINPDGTFAEEDIFSALLDAYNVRQNPPKAALIIFECALLLVFSIVFLILFLIKCGYKAGADTVSTAYIDKMPTDIHFIIFSAVIIAILFLIYAFFQSVLSDITLEWLYYSDFSLLISDIALTFAWLAFIEWLSSTVRIKKAGQSWLKNTLAAKIFYAIKNLFLKIKKIFAYKPRKFTRNTVILIIVYILSNIVFDSIAIIGFSKLFPIPIIIIALYNIGWLVLIAKYITDLDKIIAASSGEPDAIIDKSNLPDSLKILAQNLENSNDVIKEAVKKAVRDEQMKTELITNVSHDLKTPLTSLITYSDLLEKCDISDETAKKYIGVLHNQSIKLKRLIEDLIEASKVSTGNVTLNKSILNLSELAIQAIVEFTPDMEKNRNEIKFSEPETPPKVFADSSKTYRIISNLLSNAKKYSAPGTRVYVSVYNDESYGYFEIKNISNEPLNISPDDLTERFVRGDKSRTKEGNGLGLSIAKDLCALQNGELKIFIDGDLFKAIVQLPSNSSEVIPTMQDVINDAIDAINTEGVFENINYLSASDLSDDGNTPD